MCAALFDGDINPVSPCLSCVQPIMASDMIFLVRGLAKLSQAVVETQSNALRNGTGKNLFAVIEMKLKSGGLKLTTCHWVILAKKYHNELIVWLELTALHHLPPFSSNCHLIVIVCNHMAVIAK